MGCSIAPQSGTADRGPPPDPVGYSSSFFFPHLVAPLLDSVLEKPSRTSFSSGFFCPAVIPAPSISSPFFLWRPFFFFLGGTPRFNFPSSSSPFPPFAPLCHHLGKLRPLNPLFFVHPRLPCRSSPLPCSTPRTDRA